MFAIFAIFGPFTGSKVSAPYNLREGAKVAI
jgi:hypothetical protein